jgi:hypothetical protein
MSTTALAFWSELVKPDEGTETDAWAPPVIAIWDAWDRALGGRISISVTSASVTLTATQAQHRAIEVNGSPSAARSLVFPARNRTYLVWNNTTQDLYCYVTGFSSTYVFIPPSAAMAFSTESSGSTRAVGPPLLRTGGFPSTILHPGKAYSGPGMFFGDDFDVGFARRGNGQIGVCLANTEGRDSLRFNAPGTAAAPNIAMGANFNDGFFVDDGGVGWTKDGTRRGTFDAGFRVGSPSGGDKGTGTINAASFYYKNNNRLVGQDKFEILNVVPTAGTAATVAHGLAGVPTLVQIELRSTNALSGYVVGNVIVNPYGVYAVLNATNLAYQVHSVGIQVPPSFGGSGLPTINPAYWRLDIRAYY